MEENPFQSSRCPRPGRVLRTQRVPFPKKIKEIAPKQGS